VSSSGSGRRFDGCSNASSIVDACVRDSTFGPLTLPFELQTAMILPELCRQKFCCCLNCLVCSLTMPSWLEAFLPETTRRKEKGMVLRGQRELL